MQRFLPLKTFSDSNRDSDTDADPDFHSAICLMRMKRTKIHR